MEWNSKRVPAWALLNTALLFGPLVLGLFVFRLWFIPNPTLKIPALFFLVIYYWVVFYICKRTSGGIDLWVEFKKTNPSWKNYLSLTLGLVMFSLIGYAAFYVSLPALATTVAGHEITKNFKVTSSAAVYRSGCRYELRLEGASPVIGTGFCVHANEFDPRWVKGSNVLLYGRESFLGFRFTEIGS
jgi:hypothetical protein